MVHAAEHNVYVDGLGEVVVFVAISTRQVAPAHGDNMRLDNMIRGKESFRDHLQFAQASMARLHFATEPDGKGRHTSVNKSFKHKQPHCRTNSQLSGESWGVNDDSQGFFGGSGFGALGGTTSPNVMLVSTRPRL